MKIPITVLPHAKGIALPAYKTRGSSGLDLCAAIDELITIAAGKVALVPTGIAVAVPQGYEFQVRPRSGLAAEFGVTVLNTPGTIDADYRGEIKVILANFGVHDFDIERGMRIAQLVLAKIEIAEWSKVDALDETDRGAGGFGHTGRT